MAKVLNEIYGQDFLKCSFGFRPGLGCHHALATINEILYRRKLEHVLEVGIRDFFGSLSHEWLVRFLELRIGDKRVLKLIQAWLKAGIFEEGRQWEVERGTPQGGSVSPLLANVYLQAINQILRGHFNYYRIAGNARRLHTFWQFTQREWKHSLSKRSQKGRLTWERLKALMDQHPLATPRIRIRYPDLAAYARLS